MLWWWCGVVWCGVVVWWSLFTGHLLYHVCFYCLVLFTLSPDIVAVWKLNFVAVSLILCGFEELHVDTSRYRKLMAVTINICKESYRSLVSTYFQK
jgi:hypothetical protein